MAPFYVNAQPWNQSLGFGISDDYFGAFPPNDNNDVFNFGMETNIFQGGMNSDTGGVVTLPPFVVSETYFTTPIVDISTPGINQGGGFLAGVHPTFTSEGPVMLPPFTVSDSRITTPTVSLSVPATPNLTITTDDIVVVGTAIPYTSAPVTRVPSTTVPVTTVAPNPTPSLDGGPSNTPQAAASTGPQRDFEAELGKTLAGLSKYQPQILGMYKDLYQSFMPQGLTAAETSGLAQMRADEEKLNRLRQGILSPEDIRTATQGAREAYGARGQVFAPGAIGAEILNREAIRQQREDQARAAYQQSIGNLLNVSNLQTGNIFQPISSLLSGTFNPLGAYPADVYGTNVNAALARDIAERNKEAAIESARMAGAAGTSAAKTAAAGNIGAAALPAILAAIFSGCWVAREVYGEYNPRWQMFRHWLATRAPRWFVNLYLRYGETFAKWLKRNPWLKPMIRRWMDSRIESMRPNHALKEAF